MATCPECRESYPDDQEVCPKDGATLVPDELIAGADQDLRPGDRAGEYEIRSKIAEGGFGTVFRAVQPLIGKEVAVKVLRRELSRSAVVVSRFLAEAKAVNKIRHKHIINIFSFGQLADGRHYYVMDLHEGSPLDQILEAKGRLPAAEAIPVLSAVGEALDAAHEAGIAHRDLKPSNVFVTDDGDVKLLDFGIAKLLSGAAEHQTATGAALGTYRYMSPEQSRGKNVDHRTDIYSFGVMAFELLTGQPPFSGTKLDVAMKHVNDPPPKPSDVCDDIPSELDEPILRMLEKDPDDRPESLADAMAALRGAAEALGIEIPAAVHFEGITPSDLTDATAQPGEPVAPISSAAGPSVAAAESSSMVPEDTRPGNRLWLYVAIGAVVAAAAIVAYVNAGGDEPKQPEPVAAIQAADAAAAPEPEPDATPEPPAPVIDAAPKSVTITIGGKVPKGTKILAASGEVLGTAPGRFELPFSTDTTNVTLRRSGYDDLELRIQPDRDRAFEPTLVKKRRKSGGDKPNEDSIPEWED